MFKKRKKKIKARVFINFSYLEALLKKKFSHSLQ